MRSLASAVLALVTSLATAMTDVHAAEPVIVFAAGSLRAPMLDIGKAFEADAGIPVRFEFGASGLLKDRIVEKGGAHVFASANTEHPQALADAGRAQGVAVFTRNAMCALVRPGIAVTPDTLLATMLRPDLKLATSTPRADPSGDYAFEIFAKAEALAPGAAESLRRKALQLVGGPNSPAPPPGRSAYAVLTASGAADVFLTYCTNATLAVKEEPQLAIVGVPPALAVSAAYGVTVLNGAPPTATRFVDWLRGERGQSILRGYGFR